MLTAMKFRFFYECGGLGRGGLQGYEVRGDNTLFRDECIHIPSPPHNLKLR